MSEEIIYDKAKYHYEGEFPNELSIDQAFVHTGMFLGWIIENILFSKEFEQESQDEIKQFKMRKLTGTQIYMNWDGVLASDMLNDEGNEFAKDYFDFEHGLFPMDYVETFPEAETIYHVEDTWENYNQIKKVIDKRYLDWINQRSKKYFIDKFKVKENLLSKWSPTRKEFFSINFRVFLFRKDTIYEF